jgi:copper chaperone CopZ
MATTDASSIQGVVASATPGRVRIRLEPRARADGTVHRVREHVARQAGIQQVTANPTTGSVVVHYDQATTTLDDIVEVCRDLGVVVGTMVGLEPPDEVALGTTTSQRLVDAVDRIDRQLARATGRKIDLRLLFPTALFALGLRQVMASGLGLNQIPGYVLLWYAFDAFVKFNRDVPRPVGVSVETTNGASGNGKTGNSATGNGAKGNGATDIVATLRPESQNG